MALRTLALFLCLSALCLQLIQCEHWALLVAGSSGYYNYRHQADICHAYHIMKSHGIPADHIVTMMYDDIAYNEENPFKGNVINQPNGPNVYPGVVIDYKKDEVTPEVFLAVMSGDAQKVKKLIGREGKVIKSGPNDHVFVNFADHGGPGLLAFPDDTLSARKLMTTIKSMHEKKSYQKMVLYVEACESGSMFYGLLPKDINVYASTAANRSQSSYACYYDKKRDTYLGDVYSVNWMQDSDKEDLKTETIQKQFLITKEETNTSQVREYGDMVISKMTVAEFQGSQKSRPRFGDAPFVHPALDAVPARDAQMQILVQKLNNRMITLEERAEAERKLYELLKNKAQIDKLFKDIVEWLSRQAGMRFDHRTDNVLRFDSESMYEEVKTERSDITQWDCYEHALDTLVERCPGLKLSQNYHALGQLYMLVNLCEGKHNMPSVASAVMYASLTNPQLCASN